MDVYLLYYPQQPLFILIFMSYDTISKIVKVEKPVDSKINTEEHFSIYSKVQSQMTIYFYKNTQKTSEYGQIVRKWAVN